MNETVTAASRKRIPFFDLLRGVGIILVVFGHVTHDMPVREFIYGFHLPLFFFLSGTLFRDRDLARFTPFIRKKARSLLIPYVVFGLVSLFWYLIVEIRIRPIDATLSQMLLGLVYGAYTKWIWFNGALWFLPCLFTAECLLWWGLKWARGSSMVQWGIAAVAYGLSEAVFFWAPFPLPFGLEKAGHYLVFLALGHSVRPMLTLETPTGTRIVSGIGLAAVASVALALMPEGWFGQRLGQSAFYDFVAYFPVAVVGIALCVGLCRAVPYCGLLGFLGRHSLVFFAFQEQVYRLWIGVSSKVLQEPIESIRTDFLDCLVITVATFLSILPLVWLWNRRPRSMFP